MKQLFFLTTITLLTIISSCNKKDDFRINGITDLAIPANGTAALGIQVEQVNGPQQEVTLGMSGMPEKVNGYFNTQKGTTTFSANAVFEDKGAKAGVYTINIWGTGKGGFKKEYSFKLTVAQKPCLAESYAGAYTGKYACAQGPDLPTTITFYADPANANRLKFNWNGATAYMVLDCDKNEFTIPNQQLTDFSISGSAKLSTDSRTITINYTAVYFGNGNTVTCTGSFTK